MQILKDDLDLAFYDCANALNERDDTHQLLSSLRKAKISESFRQAILIATKMAKIIKLEKDNEEKSVNLLNMKASLAKAEHVAKILDMERLRLK